MSYNPPSADSEALRRIRKTEYKNLCCNPDAFHRKIRDAIRGDRGTLDWFKEGISSGDYSFINLVDCSASSCGNELIDLMIELADSGECRALYYIGRIVRYDDPEYFDTLVGLAEGGCLQASICIRNLASEGYDKAFDHMVKEVRSGNIEAFRWLSERAGSDREAYVTIQGLAESGDEAAFDWICESARSGRKDSSDFLEKQICDGNVNIIFWLEHKAEAGDEGALRLILTSVRKRYSAELMQWVIGRAEAGSQQAYLAILDQITDRGYPIADRWVIGRGDAGDSEACKAILRLVGSWKRPEFLQWVIDEADTGDQDACLILLRLVRRREHPVINRWMIDRADAGDEEAFRTILYCIRTRNSPELMRWAIHQAESGNEEVIEAILDLNDPNRYLTCYDWVEKMADAGNAKARRIVLRLARMNNPDAVQWIVKQAGTGDDEMIQSVYGCACKGNAAFDWIEEMAGNGDDDATRWLKKKEEEEFTRSFQYMKTLADSGMDKGFEWILAKAE